jgi:predicted transposase YdaD
MARGATIIDDWIAEGEARGEARGETRGRLEEARRLTREALSIRFGRLPEALAARLEHADAETCEELFRRALVVNSLDELDAEQA